MNQCSRFRGEFFFHSEVDGERGAAGAALFGERIGGDPKGGSNKFRVILQCILEEGRRDPLPDPPPQPVRTCALFFPVSNKHASLGFPEKLSTSLSPPSASVCPQATNFFDIQKNFQKIQEK